MADPHRGRCALISVATLWVTTVASSRRERTKWARDTLGTAFFDFINSSYAAGQAGKDYFTDRADPANAHKLPMLLTTFDHEQDNLILIQTRIRLLAPNKTLEAVKDVRTAIKELRQSLELPTSPARHSQLVDAIADAREAFVQVAKQNMSLPR